MAITTALCTSFKQGTYGRQSITFKNSGGSTFLILRCTQALQVWAQVQLLTQLQMK